MLILKAFPMFCLENDSRPLLTWQNIRNTLFQQLRESLWHYSLNEYRTDCQTGILYLNLKKWATPNISVYCNPDVLNKQADYDIM